MPTEPTPIAELPEAPNRSMTDAEFVDKADAWVAAQPDFREQINDVAQTTYENAVEAEAFASDAEGFKNDAETAGAAAAAASTLYATSVSSIALTASTKTVHTAETGRTFAVGHPVVLVCATDVDVRLYGDIATSDGSDDYTVSVASEGIVGTGGPYSNWIMIHQAFLPVGATAAEVRALLSSFVAITPKALADAMLFRDDGNVTGTYTPNLADGPNHKAVLVGNITLANMTNAKEGQAFYHRLKQDATGGRTISFGGGYKIAGGAPTPSTAANAVDAVSGIVLDAVTPLYDCVFIRGIA